MVYTVTLNPSLDYIIGVNGLKIGGVNRTSEEHIVPGGKGINVSIVLKNLGMQSIPLGFVAGFTGAEIVDRLQTDYALEQQFIPVEAGLSRINIKLRSLEPKEYREKAAEAKEENDETNNKTDNRAKSVLEETEINGSGPQISGEELQQFYRQLDQLQEGDVLVLAGSIPGTLPMTIYRDIMCRLADKKISIVVDATRDLLRNVLEFHPFLIKPNHIELGELFNTTIRDRADGAAYAKKLQAMGARNVLVSMAGDGAVLVSEDGKVYQSEAPEGTVVNSVGAGDSMVAGFLYGYLTTGSYEEAFRYGICTGSASAFSQNLATRAEVESLLNQDLHSKEPSVYKIRTENEEEHT